MDTKSIPHILLALIRHVFLVTEQFGEKTFRRTDILVIK